MKNTNNELTKKSKITLREVTEETVRTICNLHVYENQKKFVANNAVSIAQAYFSKNAWFRAIYGEDHPIGFLMLYDEPEKPEYFLWRFMIDKKYQKMGFGKAAINLLIEYVKKRPNANELFTSVVQESDGPQGFYERIGF